MALEANLKEMCIDTALKTKNTDTFITEKEEKKEKEEGGGGEASNSSAEPAAPPASASESVSEEKKEQLQSSSSFINVPDVTVQCEKDEYLVKTIDWKNKKVRIITQNGNVRALFVI